MPVLEKSFIHLQSMGTNYFVCTLGQALLAKEKHNDGSQIENVTSLIDQQAEENGSKPAAAFAYPSSADEASHLDQHYTKIYTFAEIRKGSNYVATLLEQGLKERGIARGPGQGGNTVALLCASTPEFLFAWLGLIRLGYAVLLIAPQCQPDAIVHLCKTCEVGVLLYDGIYTALATSASTKSEESSTTLHCTPLEFSTDAEQFRSALRQEPEAILLGNKVESTSIAYLHHTSGTSSGLPKPIAQSHKAAVGVLPRLASGSDRATFTTTPLYHGGIADLFRAWTSDALIWLFPGKSPGINGIGIQITANNVLLCLNIAASQEHLARVSYFSSVPYVLQMLASLPEGLEVFKAMRCVGVGGAALPTEVGNHLVDQGVNLLSRFGSAECGFIGSSYRDFEVDKEWQYLRTTGQEDLLSFEAREDGKYELIVLSEWPHRAKTTRPDGSFATSDLFVPHPSIPNAWKYDSRADSQLTLITGKKFDPAPLEASVATSSLLDDVLIFGDGRPFPGALLFRSEQASDTSSEDLITAIAPHVEELNSQSQSHARIPRNMLIPVPTDGPTLEKSSKGTIIRKSGHQAYKTLIDGAYDQLDVNLAGDVPDALLSQTIQDAVKVISGHEVGLSDDLYAHGVDSVGSIQLRHTLQRLLSANADTLPMTVIEDCGSMQRLTKLIIDRRSGDAGGDQEDDIALMNDLVRTYGDFAHECTSRRHDLEVRPKEAGEVVVLTGATGGLGAHLLHQYRNMPKVSKIYCLVRGASVHVATERVNRSLSSRGLATLGETDGCASSPTIHTLPCTLSDAQLGLSSEDYTLLANTVTTIVHAAWAVNFRLRLRSFIANHIAGTRHLIDLFLASIQATAQAPSTPARFIFCSSIASVSAAPSSSYTPILETVSPSPADASPLGYSRSKHVAESLLHALVTQRPHLRNRVAVLRIGQLSGDTVHGIWNKSEAWPLMLGSLGVTGCLPRLEGQKLDWLAVDVAAAAVVEVGVAMRNSAHAEASDDHEPPEKEVKAAKVYHILQPRATTTWIDLLGWLAETETFEMVEPHEWVRRLDKLTEEKPAYPALKLLEVWRAAYASEGGAARDEGASGEQIGRSDFGESEGGPVFDTSEALRVSASLREVGAVDRAYAMKLWVWVKDNVGGE